MKPQSLKPTGKHSGGNFQDRECFGNLHWTDSKYYSILQRHAPLSGLILVVKDSYCSWIMSPNNLQALTDLLEDQRPRTVPELNPTDYLSGNLKTKKAKHSATSQEALWNTVKACARITWVLRFYTNLWSPKQLQRNSENSWIHLLLLNCSAYIVICKETVLHWKVNVKQKYLHSWPPLYMEIIFNFFLFFRFLCFFM